MVGTKTSAFAVRLSNQGKLKLDSDVVDTLGQKVQSLHTDKTFNQQLNALEKKYLKNKQDRAKKKRKAKGKTTTKPKNKKSKPTIKQEKPSVRIQDDISKGEEPNPPTKNGFGNNLPRTSASKLKISEWTPPVLNSSEDCMSRQLPSFDLNTRNPENGQEINSTGQSPEDRKRKKQNDKNQVKKAVKKQRNETKIRLDDRPAKKPKMMRNKRNCQTPLDLFTKILYPHQPRRFFKDFWTKKPLHIKREDKEYYRHDNWFSTSELDRILRQEGVRFGVNIDLTMYTDGQRKTLNPAGRAFPSIVWDHYQQGCSVRLLNPQTYCDRVWYLLSTLQELFGCMMGANVYLTPAGTQGFAPHYDDIEGFVMQLEGKKHWRVYGPRSASDIWPLTSSPNLTQEELGEPIIDCVLEPGDLLYFPRGAIHQAMAQEDEHSLHITVSTHQKNTWSNLFTHLVPAALANATADDEDFRESLPIDYLNYTGIAFQDEENPARKAFMSKMKTLMTKLIHYAPVDEACDLMAKQFMHDSLPPYLSKTEASLSIQEQGEVWSGGKVKNAVELHPEARVRLIRKHCLRLVNEQEADGAEGSQGKSPEGDDESDTEDGIRVYYNTDNDRLYHGNDIQYFIVSTDAAPVIEHLQKTYPTFIAIEDFPEVDGFSEKLDLAMLLYDKGLIITEEPLEQLDTSDSELEASDSEHVNDINNSSTVN